MNAASKLRIESDVNNLAKIRNFIRQSISKPGVDEEVVDDVILAVDEAATNIMLHGYKSHSGMIEIDVDARADRLTIIITDQAPGFDPTLVPPPDLTLPLEQRPLGKYGVFLIRNNVDDVNYDSLPGGGNQLTLVKYI